MIAPIKEKNQNSIGSKSGTVLNYVALFTAVGLAIFSWWRGLDWVVVVVPVLLAVAFLLNIAFLRKRASKMAATCALQEKLDEKEILLKEVHHRVKNNLQTVSSLLSLQSRAVGDKKIESIIKGSQHRVVSMSMVHEMLYKRDDYSSSIELTPYVQELSEYLIRSVKGHNHNITTHLDLGDYSLSIDTVIPLGLIINEAITNALKYGIPGDASGEIKINLTKTGENTYELYLGDNGIGFPEDVSPANSKSLGLKLIHNLARQLRGSVARDNTSPGTYYRITFEEVIEEFNSVD